MKTSPSAAGNRICHDAEVRGFVVNHRARGRERRITIGSRPDWSVHEEAGKLEHAVSVREDPMELRHAESEAPTVAKAERRRLQEHAIAFWPRTRSEYGFMLRGYILPELGALRPVALTADDVRRLRDRVKGRHPCRAIRLVALAASITAWTGGHGRGETGSRLGHAWST